MHCCDWTSARGGVAAAFEGREIGDFGGNTLSAGGIFHWLLL